MQKKLFATLVAFVGLAGALFGQDAGTITGRVVDQTAAVVSGAEVKVTDVTTGETQKTTTNESGNYYFNTIKPGVYNVTVEKSGFRKSEFQKQTVDVGSQLTLNVSLELGASTQTVTVEASAGAELQTLSSTVGATITGPSMVLLPNLGRDASSLAVFQPGVAPGGFVAGAMSDENTFQLDGGNNSSDMDGNMTVYTPSYASNGAPTGTMPTPVESVEEFKVNTAGQTADFNGSSGSQVQMVTKRGTNQFHGAAYEYYFSTDVGAANTWDNDHKADAALGLGYTPISKAHKNRYGGALGGPMLPKFLGGKTYFFVNYEALKYPFSETYEKPMPTALLRAGVVQINESGTWVPYNLTGAPVTVNGVSYAPAQCGGAACDPLGLGMNSLVSQIWNKYMPMPNDASSGDTKNTQGYLSTIGLPQTSNFWVGRVDHDFGDKWRLFASYRYYAFSQLTTNQVDVGGLLPGDTFGNYAARAPRPQKPDYIVGGISTSITPSTTNDFHYSFLKNWWQWATSAAPPQLPGLGGALEIGGESANALIPYNINTQNTRQRFWDGHDTTLRDDVTMLKSNHLIAIGGQYERNYDYHLRNDNGQGIDNSTVYQIGNNSGLTWAASALPANLPSSQNSTFENYAAEIWGIVDQSQVLYTRSGPQLTLQPLGSNMFDQSTINFYNLYASDTWKVKPNLTLTYGLGYQVETPPTEANGKQIELVDSTGTPISISSYLSQRESAAFQGSVFNPIVGFTGVKTVSNASTKYPYNPFYGGVSPRVSFAYTPDAGDGFMGKIFGHNQTVIRGGYGRIYGRLNGVDLVLIPLLGTGLGQAVSCYASAAGTCVGASSLTSATAFRIGTNGLVAPLPAVSQTLPQPYFPGTNGYASAGSGSVLDPNFRPSSTDNFQFSIQRELKKNLILEVGYIGRKINHEWQQVDLDAVPTMTTLAGESFARAYANLYTAVNQGGTPAAQPFFEAALGGSGSAFCKAYSSCTAAIVANSTMKTQITQTQVYDFWTLLNKQSSWTLGRTLPSSTSSAIPAGQLSAVYADGSFGYGNYNAGYASLTSSNFYGMTFHSNFTYGRALGTGNQTQATSSYSVVDPWNINAMYGPQYFDYKVVYSLTMLYQEPFFKSQKGLLGHALGGWTIAPIFTARSGAPLAVSNLNGGCESFGEMNCSTGSTEDYAVLASAFTGGNSANYNEVATGKVGTTGNNNINMFQNPTQVFGEFRNCILGIDTNCGSTGTIRGMGTWNLDATVSKDFSWKERIGATLLFQFTNVLNHVQLADPSLSLASPQTFGVLGSSNPNGGQSNTPRQMEFGLRLHF